ncbi:MAG: HD domain-containing protein, partial [Actinobacteria bacterium]|nr:HD domain-containing protein [Actinomycetota bacterium]
MSDTTTGGALQALRSRLPRIFTRPAENSGIGEVIKTAKLSHPKVDFNIVEKAFIAAELAHKGQTRKSGDPYITHPVAVAQILAELGIGPAGLAAALLHDTVEDTDYKLEQLRADFGEEIAMLVDGVTKLDKVKFGEHTQAETVRK